MVPLDEREIWCSIQYFELNTKVGEPFNAFRHTGRDGIQVDGFTDPTNNGRRFCLGHLLNIQGNSAIETARRHIGRGVRLRYINGDVFADCLSGSSIFIQSQENNHRNRRDPITVVKLVQDQSEKIFSSEAFAGILQERTFGTDYPTGQFANAYDAVFELQKMCVIRMSFVKGWGAGYNRQDVTSTPCWIEIRLHGPMQWLDKVLTRLPPPPAFVCSNT